MTILNKDWPVEFPLPTVIRTIVCCDLDETYIPSDTEKKALGGVELLESYITSHAEEKGILAGWITGTNLDSAWRKSRGYISRSPHFICCSLGTEFYWVKNGRLRPSETWAERIRRSGYSLQNVNSLVRILMGKGMPLQRQPEDYQGPFKVSYYYPEGASMAVDFATIQALADERGIRVVFTRCNPAAGDPPDCYDVEFIPLCCGKDQAVSFLMEETALPKEAIIAFGDSANDFAMFAQAGRGYLVGNADPFAIRQYGSSLNAAYCHGILNVLKELQG
ncbi:MULTISPECIES: HAD-IIB family hydrolase [Enterobacterales]|uniref:HAD-IIB family hydrolase n=1 Tax=Enterobacterales TaxID=91347 RepID=UPI0015DD876C|nr:MULTISPECIES: HAD-IIB family hydrolase [Enterobacterales]MBA0219453.1 HAD-IIB family hydrolase [Pectobacterium brasiliense]MBN3074418.1 HAD-IIB family hydrolase [Pectobacterium brasiliense]MBN3171580.1 HAD-IIB family hydrolase [Pectobacterium brasiliense]